MAATLMGETPDSPALNSQTNVKQSYTRTFLVKTGINDGPNTARDCAGVPIRWESYAFGSELSAFCWVVDYSTTPVATVSAGTERLWHVGVKYETPDPGEDAQDSQTRENPMLELPTASGGWDTKSVPMQGNFGDDDAWHAWTNSAGEVYPHPPEKDTSSITLSITINKPITFNILGQQMAYRDKVNSDIFWGQAAGTCKVKSITWECNELRIENSSPFPYLRVKYDFQFCDEESEAGQIKWDLQLLDFGTYYIQPEEGFTPEKKIAFKTDDGHRTTGLLAGNGQKLPDDTPPIYLPPVARYRSVAFATLGLPQSPVQCKTFPRL
ncbi:MAG: hypothetical protein HY253_12915 [Burkholderiales bacterium]|nr:hypothetical protein [Burkholderiales bacterium]